MFLRVSNLGPIREATLDLSKELVVLTGPNNAGKTYLTWTVYGLSRLDTSDLPIPDGFIAWAEKLVQSPKRELPIDSLREVARTQSSQIHSDLAAALQMQLSDVFATSAERFSKTQVQVSGEGVRSSGLPRVHQVYRGPRWSGSLIITSKLARFVIRPAETNVEDIAPEEKRSFLKKIARGSYFSILREYIEFGSAVFPVERLAVNLFARELGSSRVQLVDDLLERVEEATAEEMRRSLLSRAGYYPLVIRDALQRALRLSVGIGEDNTPYRELAFELEKNVLGGTLNTGAGEFKELEFRPSSATVPLRLHQSASMVKSLASLVWFLRYTARPGQRVIIDEPELNLHPDNQRRVARVLAKAVNQGLRLMVSTHSDYFIRELNNLIMLGQDSDAARELVQELGYDSGCTLAADKIGVYLVNGGECQPVTVEPTGFEISTIDEEIHRLNRDSQLIYNRLFCD